MSASVEIPVLRTEVRRHIDESTMSQAKFARKIGVSPSTLNQWLSGTYAGDNEAIAAKCRETLKILAQRVTVARESSFLQTSVAKKVQHVCSHAQVARDLGVIVGPPGLGKSLALRRFGASAMAVLITVSINFGYPKAVLQALLAALRLDNTGSQYSLWERLRAALTDTERLVIFDEAQHLQSDSLELMRQLQDECEFGMVWAGNPKVINRVRSGAAAAFAQIWSRVGITANFEPLTPNAFRDDVVMLAESRGFGSPDLHDRLYRIAREGGWLRSVDKILSLAVSYACGDPPGDAHVEAAIQSLGWS